MKPISFLGAKSFRGRVETSTPSLLDREYSLEFIPISKGSSAKLTTYVILDGEELPLAVHSTIALNSDRFDGSDRFAVLGDIVSINLGAYRGETVRFGWVLEEGLGEGIEAALGAPRLRPTAGDQRRPDVLLICSDTHRFDYALGSRGRDLMPGLQELAGESVVYENGFSNASWTMPSIVSALTGLYPRRHSAGRVTRLMDSSEVESEAIPAGRFIFQVGQRAKILTAYSREFRSLPEILRAHGYTTAIVAANPLYFLSGLAYDGNDLIVNASVLNGAAINQAAGEIIANAPASHPLFLLVHYMEPHQWQPWYFYEDYPGLAEVKSRAQVLQSYSNSVGDLDDALSALLEVWARERGMSESLVAFYSDHGEHLLDPGQAIVGHGQTMDEALLRVPYVIKYPQSLSIPHAIEKNNVSLADLTPTVLDVAGIGEDDFAFSGRSLRAGDVAPNRYLFADFQLYGNALSSVRQGNFKLVVNHETGTSQLVDTRSGETVSDSAGLRETRDQLASAFRKYQRTADEQSASIQFARQIDQDEALESLKSLGYVGGGQSRREKKEVPAKPIRPTITRLHPSETVAGEGFNVQPGGESAIAVAGKGFEPGSKIQLNGAPLPTTYGNPELLSAKVPAEIYGKAKSIRVTVQDRCSIHVHAQHSHVRATCGHDRQAKPAVIGSRRLAM